MALAATFLFRMRIALAQIRPEKADYAANVRRVGGVLAQVASWPEPPGLVTFGEAVMTGYFLEQGVQEHAVTAGTLYRDLTAAHRASGAPPLDVCLGFYERFEARVFNSGLYATLGGADAGIRHVHRKVFLPTYGLFDESRFMDAGTSVAAFDTSWGRVAMLVCEDAWHSATSTIAALDGARLILVPSASPARVASVEGRPASVQAWERVVCRIAEEHGAWVALTQLTGFEGGKALQGGSVLAGPDGAVVASAPVLDEALIRAEVTETALRRARAAQPMLGDLEVAWPGLISRGQGTVRSAPGDTAEGAAVELGNVEASKIAEVRAAPTPDPLAIDPGLLEGWLVRFLREELAHRGFTKGVVGVSGGVDSAVTLALAARALGPENVVAVSMPYVTSSADSRSDAAAVATAVGAELTTLEISPMVDAYFAALGERGDDTRRGNVMARIRMITLFDLSARHQAMPLGTGNKSERLLGYFTWHGDDAPPVNPLGDLYKTQVLVLARHLGIPESVITKPATADLVQGQTDEGDLGVTYATADPILHWILSGYQNDEIEAMGFTAADVATVRRRLDATHWKRRPPTVAMVSRHMIGESWLRPVDY